MGLQVSIRPPMAMAVKLAWKEPLRVSVGASGGGGTLDHSVLQNRGAPDQHPIAAISGLEAELDGRNMEAMSNTDIETILGGFYNG